MSENFAVLRFEKLKTYENIKKTCNHNRRLVQPKNANEELTGNNLYSDNNTDLSQKVNNRITECLGETKPRSNAVLAFETLMSFTPKSIKSDKDLEEWKNESIKFLEEQFGKDNVVDWALHLDETTPHIHAIVVPIDNNKKGKNKLSCKSFIGERKFLRELQTEYANKMGKFGLRRGVQYSNKHHTKVRKYYGQIEEARQIYKNQENKEQELKSREQALNTRVEAIEKWEKDLNKWEQALNNRDNTINKWFEHIKNWENKVNDTKQDLETNYLVWKEALDNNDFETMESVAEIIQDKYEEFEQTENEENDNKPSESKQPSNNKWEP